MGIYQLSVTGDIEHVGVGVCVDYHWFKQPHLVGSGAGSGCTPAASRWRVAWTLLQCNPFLGVT